VPSLRGNVTTASTTSSSATVNRPSGVVAGDTLLALQAGEYWLNGGLPAGWAEIFSDFYWFSVRLAVKIAGTSEPTSYSFGGGSNGVRNNVMLAAIGEADPTLRSFQVGNGGSNQSVTAPSITAARGDALVIRFAAVIAGAAATFSTPSGHTKRAEISQSPISCVCATQNTLADGTVNSASFSTSESLYDADSRVGITVLLYPPPSGGGRIVTPRTAAHRAASW